MFTVITSTLNCKDELRKTALSLLSQTFVSVQWIVIDGGSSDGTQDVIAEFESIISMSVSEPDSGIYDAWNKACKFIENKWVIFLGAGDTFANINVLSNASNFLKNFDEGVSYVYGKVISDSSTRHVLSSGEIHDGEWDLYRPKLPYHQGVFHNSVHLRAENVFDCSYRVVSDTKLLLHLNKLGSRKYIPMDIAIMALGGVSQSPQNALKVMREFLRLEKEMKYRIPTINRMVYIFITYAKWFLFRCFGSEVLKSIISVKRKFLLPK